MASPNQDLAQQQGPSTLHRPYLSTSPSLHRAHSHLDEGFSEDTRSLPESDVMLTDTALQEALMRALDLPVEQRKELVTALVKSLPNTDKEDIGDLCERLTHFDPVHFLPNELMLHTLSYLTPKDLLVCSTISRAWRESSQDEKLWRGCFAREGWVVDTFKMKEFEERAKARQAERAQHPHSELQRRGSHKRPHEEAFSEVDTPGSPAGISDTISLRGNVSSPSSIDGMEIETTSSGGTLRQEEGEQDSSDILIDSSIMLSPISRLERGPGEVKVKPTLFRSPQDMRLSWPYLYKQRCKLERNWDAGAYDSFQLPHPSHPEEGHAECVYTIQHNNNHLVSGSRDRTIRIWNLKYCRLKQEPLKGHEASVLCLQFDDRPEHDIIVSGGSDSYVIVWKFSTGEIIKKMTNAHAESVLNLRFDDRYIVTCSKDKTIKVWNRRALQSDDPDVPTHILPQFASFAKDDIIKEYSLLMSLTGHGAAVNAVMIHEDTIVSASGDRTIKSWDINTGKQKKTYNGHTKGIACVQFDGRRIVSGSSDNTVRIFDAHQAAEIACLQGHGNLVRTVQARFGDLDTVTDEELETEARQVDERFHAAVRNGMTPATSTRNGLRNAGSSRPQDILAYGTKIPPGGGGSKWAKIVSGSYDETVIVWKRDRDGKWVVKHRLHQGLLVRSMRRTALIQQNAQNEQTLLQLNQQLNPAQQLQTAHTGLMQVNHVVQGQPPGHGPGLANSTLSALAVAQHTIGQQLAQQQQQQQQPNAAGAAGPANPPAVPNAAPHHHHHHHGHAHAANPAGRTHPDSNRVFKLEFDTRRIVCCSQNKVIVGWDFAKGDRELQQISDWSIETQ